MKSNFEFNFGCGTVLRDHPDVEKQARKYKTISSSYNNTGIEKNQIPVSFDGIKEWRSFYSISLPQYGNSDWAYTVKKALIMRMNIYCYGNFYLPDFSESEILLMMTNLTQKPKLDNVKSSLFNYQKNDIWTGFSLYDSIEYCYMYGFPLSSCFNFDLLDNFGINLNNIKTNIEREKIVQDNKELLDRSHCLKKYGNKFIGRRQFRIDGCANVGIGRDDTLEMDIIDIKGTIYRYGPIVCGCLLFEDFLDYTGKDVYTGPQNSDNSGNSKVIGGGSFVIMGWGVDKIYGEYWQLLNTVGRNWGSDGGFFKMKMRIKECMLEKNVITIMPELLNYKDTSFLGVNYDIGKVNNFVDREKINLFTFYTDRTTEMIKSKQLYGTLKSYDIYPLVQDKYKLLNLNIHFAGRILDYSKDISEMNYSDTRQYMIIMIILVLLITYLEISYFYK